MIKQIFLFAISLVSILVLSELFIRTSHLSSVSSTELYEDIGRGRRKNLNYIYFNEGMGIGKFNEYRYIGEANSPKKDKNTVRVILLGDSYVEAFQVFERNYFGEIAETYLHNKIANKNFELLNFGRSGFDIANMFAYEKTFVDKFDPDYILYMISNQDLIPKYSDPLRPRTVIEKDSLKIVFNFDAYEVELFEKTKFLTQYSSLFNMLNNGRKKANEGSILAILFDKVYIWFNPEPNPENIPLEKTIQYQINPVTRKIMESLDPNKVIMVNRDTQKLPPEFLELCREKGLKYLDLSTCLNLMKDNGDDPTEWKVTNKRGHWNINAHKTVGQEIAKFISHTINN